MCRCVGLKKEVSSIVGAIHEIDPECHEDFSSPIDGALNTHGCKHCEPIIKKRCDGVNCCWDPNINGYYSS